MSKKQMERSETPETPATPAPQSLPIAILPSRISPLSPTGFRRNESLKPSPLQLKSSQFYLDSSSQIPFSPHGTLTYNGIRIGEQGIVNKRELTPITPELNVLQSVEIGLHKSVACFQDEEVFHIPHDEIKIKDSNKLGFGATSNVYLVEYQGRMFAVKRIPLFTGETKIDNIVREVKSMFESLRCPYILRCYDAYCSKQKGCIEILLEYMDCGSLDDVYKLVGKIPENVLAQIAFHLLQGLKYLREHTIIHRDLKPSNILLNSQGLAKISDFGMSNKLQKDGFESFEGTYMYMSPERLRGDTHSFDSDIWSAGILLAECAMGKYPFVLQQYSVFELMQQISDQKPEQFLSKDSVSTEFFTFLVGCCSIEPANRKTPEELLQYEFIKKYNSPHDNKILKDWLITVYMPAKKAQELEKKKQVVKRKVKKDDKKNVLSSVLISDSSELFK